MALPASNRQDRKGLPGKSKRSNLSGLFVSDDDVFFTGCHDCRRKLTDFVGQRTRRTIQAPPFIAEARHRNGTPEIREQGPRSQKFILLVTH